MCRQIAVIFLHKSEAWAIQLRH